MLSAKMPKTICYQNQCYPIFYLITLIISCCSTYVLSSSNVSATSSSIRCLPDQSAALLQFKQEFAFIKPDFNYYYYLCSISSRYPYYVDTYQSYPKMMKFWKAEKDCCSWDGVSCNLKTGQVIGLDLANSWLQGPLHSNSSLFKLHQLQEINLSFNNFSFSPIPSEFGQLSRLTHLNLSFSMFYGNIPSEISFLTNLVLLDLSSFKNYDETSLLYLTKVDFTRIIQNMTNLSQLNLRQVNISSSVPESLANLSSLTFLRLGGCDLLGKFPENIFLLPKLQYINVRCNSLLTGFLPPFKLSSSLRVLILDDTNFSGKLPDSIGYLKSLNMLSLWNCSFVGPIPSSIWNLSQLTILDLSWNHFNGQKLPSTVGNLENLIVISLGSCQLSGELPSYLGNLTQLEYLSLSSNSFSGQISASLGNLIQLQHLNLSDNSFSGEIPSSLGNLTQLQYLGLFSNNLNGVIPSSLGNLTQLQSLRLFSNNLNGVIPSSLGNLTQLQSLGLFSNNLNGVIPSSLGNLTQLQSLGLFSNNLNGVIPSFLFKMPSLNYLALGSNQFAGPLRIQNISSSKLEILSLAENKLNGEIPQSMFKLVNLVYLSLVSNNLSGTLELSNFSKLINLRSLSLSSIDLSIRKYRTSELPKFQVLYLSSCNISEFPEFLNTQDELEVLDLSGNRIDGQIPKWFWSAIGKMEYLDYLDLSSNMLEGPLIVPPMFISDFCISGNNLSGRIHPSFRKWTNLKTLGLAFNQFDGTIPRWLCNFSSSLENLNLQGNNFEGNLHEMFTFGSTHNLKTLDLSHNQFQGQIPQSLSNCSKLQILNLEHNQISDIFPFWLQNLQELQVVLLRSNKFYGPIWNPHKFCGFVKLRIMDLALNNFNGSLPSKYFSNWSGMIKDVDGNKAHITYLRVPLSNNIIWYYKMIMMNKKGVEMKENRIPIIYTSVDLSSNRFEGEIPSSIGKLGSLVFLNLSNNSFTGYIPASIGNMRQLESLDLSENKLFGRIPQQLTDLSFLSYLNLSQNQLTGQIPQGRQFDTFPISSFQENPGLCGSPLSKKCEPEETPISYQSEVEFAFSWKEVAMGYGCGFVVGSIIGYVLLFRQGTTGLFWRSFIGRYIYRRW